MTHLEQQKAKAQQEYRDSELFKRLQQVESIYSTRSYATPYTGENIPDMINRLIEATHQAAIEECVRVVEDGFSGEELLYGTWLKIKADLTTLKADK
jgi:hypothetical protein